MRSAACGTVPPMCTQLAPQRPTIQQRLCRIEDTLAFVVELLEGLTNQEEEMSANESAEATALNEAIAGLQAELADVDTVDAEIVTDLEGVKGAIEKVGPTTPEQVNAITAATSSLASLTAKLKAAGQSAATVEAGAGEGEKPAEGGGGVSQAAPEVAAISPVQGPAAGGGAATISGSNLQGASVTFDGVEATGVTPAADGTSLQCVVPAGSGGATASVVVTTPGGTASTTYTYETAPAA